MGKIRKDYAFEIAVDIAKILAAKAGEGTALYDDHAINVADFIKTLTEKLSEIEIG